MWVMRLPPAISIGLEASADPLAPEGREEAAFGADFGRPEPCPGWGGKGWRSFTTKLVCEPAAAATRRPSAELP